LAGFAKGLKVKYSDIEVGVDLDPEPGLADNGDLEGDLTALLEEVGLTARNANTAVVLFIDELQYLDQDQFGFNIGAAPLCAQPQLRGLAGNAKSYAERLLHYPMIGALAPPEAELAIVKPAKEEGVDFTPEAVAEILSATRGYPYFLQEWGKHSWDVAARSPITLPNVAAAAVEAIAALDESFFRVRFDRLTPNEKKYLRAMAELGPGPHRSGDIALTLNKAVNSLGPIRQSLIAKGMIWSPSDGDTAFTVPLFDEFMKRIMPGAEWKTE
jgi:hypothetical protein